MPLRFSIPFTSLLATAGALAITAAVSVSLLWPGAGAASASTPAANAPLVLRGLGASPSGPEARAPRAAAAAAAAKPLSPGQIGRAYGLPVGGAAHQTVAVVSAFDDATLASDMARYDKYFKLPPCTFKNRCLRKVNEQGKGSPLPGPDSSGGTWTSESALGTELVHALCQSCRILLAEANFADVTDFSRAAEAAAKAGAGTVITTYVPSEDPGESSYESAYSDPHAAYVAATGDDGYSGSLNFPAVLPNVLAIGGTNLKLRRGGYGGETAWSGTVSGCSIYLQAPSWQSRIEKRSGCGGNRAGVDVSAMSSPGTIIYASNVNGHSGGGFYQAEGTSVSAPIIGAIIGLAGSRGNSEAKLFYARQQADSGGLHDITSGADASECTRTICNSGPGWDGPTGFGTPIGLEEFLPGGPALSAHRPRFNVTASRGELRVRRHWRVSLDLINDNPFRVSGGITLRRTLYAAGRRRTLIFTQRRVGRSSLQRGNLTLTIARAGRALLRRERRLQVWAFVGLKGAFGRTVVVKRAFTLIAP